MENIKIEECEKRFGLPEDVLVRDILESSKKRPTRVNCGLNCQGKKTVNQITFFLDQTKKVIRATCSKELSRDCPLGSCLQMEYLDKDIVWHKE